MKRFLLTLILMTFAGFASAQSFTFEHNGETVEPGTYDVIGDIDPVAYDMGFSFNVRNITNNNIVIKCDRVILEQSHSDAMYPPENNVCTGESCYPSFMNNIDIELSGNAEVEFAAHFLPAFDDTYTYPLEGSSMKVQYSFYTNTDDEPVVLIVNFKYSTASVEDYSDARIFSNAYPNPAKNMVSFDYNMPANTQTASVAIYNMMGQEVIKQELNLGDSRVNINVSDLTDGVYFYSLIVNNKTVKTNKLVVSK